MNRRCSTTARHQETPGKMPHSLEEDPKSTTHEDPRTKMPTIRSTHQANWYSRDFVRTPPPARGPPFTDFGVSHETFEWDRTSNGVLHIIIVREQEKFHVSLRRKMTRWLTNEDGEEPRPPIQWESRGVVVPATVPTPLQLLLEHGRQLEGPHKQFQSPNL